LRSESASINWENTQPINGTCMKKQKKLTHELNLHIENFHIAGQKT
jgi:hypothetical protein